MSGYLEVKYPFKSNLGLNPFKSWKRQWCILRPSPTCSGGGSLAVYCSEAGAPAGTVELPSGCVVRRAKSRSRPHAFAVFSEGDPRKPRILLAAPSLSDAQLWMDKIRDLLNGSKWLGSEGLLKDSYSVTVVATELSRKAGITGDSRLTVSARGLFVSRAQKLDSVLEWKHISDVLLVCEATDKSKTCVLTVNSEYHHGSGELRFASPLAAALARALRAGLARRALSRSEGDLRGSGGDVDDEIRRSSWYSGPSEVSLDDIDLIMSKEAQRIPRGQLARCAAAPHLAPAAAAAAAPHAHDDSMCDRRSLVSIASGIYEEIPDLPIPEAAEPSECAADAGATEVTGVTEVTEVDGVTETAEVTEATESAQSDESVELYCPMGRDLPDGVCRGPAGLASTMLSEEPMYESVVECVYATMRRAQRRAPAPPLPPRTPFGTNKLGSWNCRGQGSGAAEGGVTRHGSLGALPLCRAAHAHAHAAHNAHAHTRTLPKPDKTKQTFSVFRKRLKSDSRIASSPKCDTAKENKGVETKKKRFEFTPTRDLFKSFKVSRKSKGLKPAASLGKVETKSCEFLDEAPVVSCGRCARSAECLDDEPDLAGDFDHLSVTTLALPQEIVDLIIRGREQFKIRLKESPEADYLPMSPGLPPPRDHHYMIMSPRTNLA